MKKHVAVGLACLAGVACGHTVLVEAEAFSQRGGWVMTKWGMDLHYPHPENLTHFPGQAFRSIARTRVFKPYAIPFRCLYSRNLPNLMMAGRDIRVTHVALVSVRVMRTTGMMMGESVGMSAALCAKYKILPRDIFSGHFGELKEAMRKGFGHPPSAKAMP